MRVLLLNDSATPSGGAELQTLRLRTLLRDAGHDARVFASGVSDLPGASQADVITHGSIHPRRRVLNQTCNPLAVRDLRRTLASFEPDVVHVRMMLTQLSPAILPVLRDVPTLWQIAYLKAICPRGTKLLPDGTRCHEPAGRACLRNDCVTPQSLGADLLQQRLWRAFSGAIDVAVTLSETMRDLLASDGVRGVGVLGNPVEDRGARPPLGTRPVVGYAGRLVPEKGVDLLIGATDRLLHAGHDLRLVVAGDGPQRPALEAQVHRLGLEGRVEFLGHVDRVEVERRMAEAWVQVVPGRWHEPLGNVTLEAMMRGSAVVVTDLGGPAEVVEHDRTGLVVEPDSIASLARGIGGLLADRDRCEELGRAARLVALERHAEPVVLARLLALYDETRRRAATRS